MKQFLAGKKTYTSILIFAVGFFGVAHLITQAEVAQLVDNILGIIGIVGAVYGRYAAKPKE